MMIETLLKVHRDKYELAKTVILPVMIYSFNFRFVGEIVAFAMHFALYRAL